MFTVAFWVTVCVLTVKPTSHGTWASLAFLTTQIHSAIPEKTNTVVYHRQLKRCPENKKSALCRLCSGLYANAWVFKLQCCVELYRMNLESWHYSTFFYKEIKILYQHNLASVGAERWSTIYTWYMEIWSREEQFIPTIATICYKVSADW